MRSIEKQARQTPEIRNLIGENKVAAAEPFRVETYPELVRHVARLAYLNKDYLLFYRGQVIDYLNKGGSSSFYPTIYRGEHLKHSEIRHRFDILHGAGRLLADRFRTADFSGAGELNRKRYIQWSILQHYGVCRTPLIDVTHSVAVACSFAVDRNDTDTAYFYVFGLPYVTNRISVNSEHDMVNVRLLSVCPPDAVRPYFQDGYLVGTDEIQGDYDDKTELDLKNRLIAKFQFANTKYFWTQDFVPLPQEALYPRDDVVETVCLQVTDEAERELQSGVFGDFLAAWAQLEDRLVEKVGTDKSAVGIRSTVRKLEQNGLIEPDDAAVVKNLRAFRNVLVNEPLTISPEDVRKNLEAVHSLSAKL